MDETHLIKALFNPQDKKRRFFLYSYFGWMHLDYNFICAYLDYDGDISPLEVSNDVQSQTTKDALGLKYLQIERMFPSNSGRRNWSHHST